MLPQNVLELLLRIYLVLYIVRTSFHQFKKVSVLSATARHIFGIVILFGE